MQWLCKSLELFQMFFFPCEYQHHQRGMMMTWLNVYFSFLRNQPVVDKHSWSECHSSASIIIINFLWISCIVMNNKSWYSSLKFQWKGFNLLCKYRTTLTKKFITQFYYFPLPLAPCEITSGVRYDPTEYIYCYGSIALIFLSVVTVRMWIGFRFNIAL